MANQSDVVLIGAGIMSGTLGTLIKEILPEQSITILKPKMLWQQKVQMNGTMLVQGIQPYVS